MNIAILTAGGKGTRFGADVPKQFLKVHGKPILLYDLLLFQKVACIDKVVTVCADGWQDYVQELKDTYCLNKLITVIKGGDSRYQSIYNGLSFCFDYCSDEDILLIHDAVRPCITEEIITDSIEKAQEFGASLAAAPCFDTMYVSKDGQQIERTYPREKLFKGQTPISIQANLAKTAYGEAIKQDLQTDSPAVLLMRLGYRVVLSKGSQLNLKITVPDDIQSVASFFNSSKSFFMDDM